MVSIQEELELLRIENAKLLADDMEPIRRGRGKTAVEKAWKVVVKDGSGNIMSRPDPKKKMIALDKSFDKPQECERWAVLRLMEGASDWYAEITYQHSSKVKNIITRNEAFGKFEGRKTYPVTQSKSGYAVKETLTFPWKVKETRVEFSRG